MQVGVFSVDWALVGAVLDVLLPPNPLSLLGFLGFFFVAILLGMASHVPGGIGVFEWYMVLLLKPYLSSVSCSLLSSSFASSTICCRWSWR